MEISNIQIIVFAALVAATTLLAGCATTDELKPNSYPTIIVEKKVPVKCELPTIQCEFKGEGLTPTIKLLECVKLQKEIIKICTETK